MEARLTFYRGRRGDIISRLPNGKIVLVNRRAERIPKPGEKWVCRIDFEKPKFAVVTPIQRIVKKPVYKVIQYACGHSKKIRLYDKEMPENEEPEIRVTKSPNVCEKCKENCKHLETEWDTSISIFYFEIRRICKKCRKTVDSYDFSNLIDENRGFFVADFEKIREAIRQRISDSEGQQIALRVLDDMEQYVREYKEYSKREKELKEIVNMINDFDILLVEGLKTLPLPRIAIFRNSIDESYFDCSEAIAIDETIDQTQYAIPESIDILDLNNPAQIIEWINAHAKEL